MYLIGARGQQVADRRYRFFGAIASATASQLVSPIPTSRAYLFFQNLSNTATMYVGIGSALATATIAGGSVPRYSPNPGIAGNGYGSGGGGGNEPTASSSAEAGAAGAQGIVIVYEYN